MFNYPYINFFTYPSGAGGKFLINCLSLNDKAVFCHSILAQQQIDGKFSVDDKLNYIFKHLQIAKQRNNWT
jgi:hypothetical protein